ncbi:MAG TPA: tetratricopeptide repeat protein [Blastocatellia bacterium]|nr:tetratricopeptide repeat protein [Blastocatellia bacterium]
MSGPNKELFEFDGFCLDPAERRLMRDGEPVPLEPKVFETLLVLVRRAGRLVEKDELMRTIWPDSFVEEVNLARNISILRKALNRNDGGPAYIETVPKRGYRFVGHVRTPAGEQAELIVQSATISLIVEEENDESPSREHDQATRRAGKITQAPEPDTTIEWRRSSLGKLKRHRLVLLLTLVTLTAAVASGVYFFRHGKGSSQPAANAPIESIAVLPFVNAAQDPNAEYLADGITGSLIDRLSRLSNLKVMSSSSVFHYKGTQPDTQKVGSDLNVRAVLTGGVKQIGDRLIINVSLDDATDNHHIWGEQYVRQFADILAVQNDIAQDVSTTLRVQLTAPDERQLGKRYTDNVEAYQLYLKGNYEWNKRTREDLQKAIEYYNQALAKDPNYALAYSGLSGCYGVLGNNYLPPKEAYPLARDYAAKALAIDDTLAEAHVAIGGIKLFYDWDRAGAENEFKRAQLLDPNNASAHQLWGDCLEMTGRFDEAQAERRRALELDPLSPAQNMVAGATFYFAGQYDEAIAQLERAINLEPHNYPAYIYLGQAYGQKKLYEQAIALYRKGMKQAEGNSQLIAALGHAEALAGERDKALKALAELREMSRHRYVSPYWFAVIYLGLGDKDQTFAWLEKAYQERSYSLLWLKVEPLFDSLRSGARFQDLLRRVGLPTISAESR